MSPVQLRGVTLGEGRTKVIVPVTASTPEELVAQTTTLTGVKPDIIEWRVDFLDASPSPVAVLEAAARIRIVARDRPVVFTFRSHHENGNKPITPDEYHDLNIAASHPAWWMRSTSSTASSDQSVMPSSQPRRTPGYQ